MKPLEDYSLGERIIATFIIVVIMLLILALIGWFSGGWDIDANEGYRVASAEDGLQASKYDDRIFELDKEAAGNAYREQIEHLFATWMKAPGDMAAPQRAAVGARGARKAYIAVMEAIEKREAEVKKLSELNR
jgi:hypothetical protein